LGGGSHHNCEIKNHETKSGKNSIKNESQNEGYTLVFRTGGSNCPGSNSNNK
jgi:hypothetical protein